MLFTYERLVCTKEIWQNYENAYYSKQIDTFRFQLLYTHSDYIHLDEKGVCPQNKLNVCNDKKCTSGKIKMKQLTNIDSTRNIKSIHYISMSTVKPLI